MQKTRTKKRVIKETKEGELEHQADGKVTVQDDGRAGNFRLVFFQDFYHIVVENNSSLRNNRPWKDRLLVILKETVALINRHCWTEESQQRANAALL